MSSQPRSANFAVGIFDPVPRNALATVSNWFVRLFGTIEIPLGAVPLTTIWPFWIFSAVASLAGVQTRYFPRLTSG